MSAMRNTSHTFVLLLSLHFKCVNNFKTYVEIRLFQVYVTHGKLSLYRRNKFAANCNRCFSKDERASTGIFTAIVLDCYV